MEKDIEPACLASIPKSFRRHRSDNSSLEETFRERLTGTVAVHIITFAPNLVHITLWLADLLIRLTPASIKTYLLRRDLHRLHTFYATLDDIRRGKVHHHLNIPKILERVYESTTFHQPQNVRLLGHALLDQVLWKKSDAPNNRTSRSENIFPPVSTSRDFQLSRIEYMFHTVGAKDLTSNLVTSGQWLTTMELMRAAIESGTHADKLPLLEEQLCSVVKHLPPAETLAFLERCYSYPLSLREAVFQHLLDGLSGMSRIKRFTRIVRQTIGHISFICHILEPQCIEPNTISSLSRLSVEIFQRLTHLKYPFLRKQECKNLLAHHPAGGASLILFVDYAILKDYVCHVQMPIHRLIGSEEFVLQVVRGLHLAEGDEYNMARYVCSRLCFLPYLAQNWFFYLRLMEHHPSLDDDMRLAFFEGLSNSLRTEDDGRSIARFYSDIDTTIGLESFFDHVINVFGDIDQTKSSHLVSTCVQSYALQILTLMLNDIPNEFKQRVCKKLKLKEENSSTWNTTLEQHIRKISMQ